MDRRRFLLTSLAGALGTPLTVGAQQAGKMARVGLLSPSQRASPEEMARNAFYVPMRELGWVEGQNVAYELRYANGQSDLLPRLAAEVVASEVHVILTVASAATRAA